MKDRNEGNFGKKKMETFAIKQIALDPTCVCGETPEFVYNIPHSTIPKKLLKTWVSDYEQSEGVNYPKGKTIYAKDYEYVVKKTIAFFWREIGKLSDPNCGQGYCHKS
jgi:hypothetical protein